MGDKFTLKDFPIAKNQKPIGEGSFGKVYVDEKKNMQLKF